MPENSDTIVIFTIYGQFGAIPNAVSGDIVCKTYIFIKSNFLSYQNWKQKLKISITAFTRLLWVKVLFFPKSADFLEKKY